ncbi:glycosyl transferase family 2 [Tannerella sp. oral taxon 808]|nr:glycosyl transferase family 2 [Tannerella sp. oral taxon 808]PNE29558.1 glycosyl transferase family 2 [Tannerella sp. oral taxon 808]
MIQGKVITVVMPAYNAEQTLRQTYAEIPFDIVDHVVLVDDASSDRTTEVARELGIRYVIRHKKNKGYGGNQKTCYNKALEIGSDIVVMLHPDYQYTPLLLPSICHMIASGLYPAVIASRILGKGARVGGMPLYKYVANRLLTFAQNTLMSQKLSEYHTGYRAFTREVLQSIPYEANSDDFVFDNQMLAQILYKGFPIGEVSCPTKYFKEASSINLRRSITYGWGVLGVAIAYRLQKMHLAHFKIFKQK